MKRAKALVPQLLFWLLLASAVYLNVFSGCSERDNPASSANCGSGNVYWDTGVARCRDRANGQFVASVCCGH